MSQTLNLQLLQAQYTDVRFDAMVRALDKLHDATSEGQIEAVSPLPKEEIAAWLREIAFLAQETLAELDQAEAHPEGVQYRLTLLINERKAPNVKTGGGSRGQ